MNDPTAKEVSIKDMQSILDNVTNANKTIGELISRIERIANEMYGSVLSDAPDKVAEEDPVGYVHQVNFHLRNIHNSLSRVSDEIARIENLG